MRTPVTAFGLLLLAPLAFGACAPKYYAPNTQNVPLLTRRGDYSAVAAVGDSRFELQGAYAITESLAVLADAAHFDKPDDEQGDGGGGGLLEVGIGYLRPVDEHFHVGLFGLVGGGDVENHFPSTVSANPGTTGTLEAKLARFGVQPVFGFHSRYVEGAASMRVVGLRYSDIRGSLIFGGEDQVQMLSAQTHHTLLEPALTLRAGFETVKVQVQLGWSVNKGHSSFRQDEGHLTAGVVYSPR
jgi:hypothetical protein